jgi:transcription elongation factor Elf1
MQRQIKIDGVLSPCPRCGKQPKHWLDARQGGQHTLECSPCGMASTAPYPTFQQAVESWEAQSVTQARIQR